jgi:N-acetylglucosaminyldiphosphoundecaprenol N-acetyl-beta-D-mannosaminyltransferase
MVTQTNVVSMLNVLVLFVRRAFDMTFASLLLVILSPFFCIRGAVAFKRMGSIFKRVACVGRQGIPFNRLGFADNSFGQQAPVLLNVLSGDMGFVGPRALEVEQSTKHGWRNPSRLEVRPGVFSPFVLRRNIKIAHEPEDVVDMEFMVGETLMGNVGLISRALIAAGLRDKTDRPSPSTLTLLGIPIANISMDQALDQIIEAANGSQKNLVAFVNPDCLNIAYHHAEYAQTLRNSALVLPDGIGIHLGCRLRGLSLNTNVNGTDLFPRLCERLAAEGLSLYLLGGARGIAAETARRMQGTYPNLKIAGTRDGYFSHDQEKDVVEAINKSSTDVLLVGMGVPRQELWLARHHSALTPAIRMGVGGLFDFFSGRIPRAPLWIREIGLEWLWRLFQEPGRLWRRYVIGNPLFLYRVWKQSRVGGMS